MFIRDDMCPKNVATAHKRFCSCQKPINDCDLWSKFIQFVQHETRGLFGLTYKYLINLAYNESGSDSILIDFSKNLLPLRQLIGSLQTGQLADLLITKDDLLVLHLVKDVRAYVTSMKKRKNSLHYKLQSSWPIFTNGVVIIRSWNDI